MGDWVKIAFASPVDSYETVKRFLGYLIDGYAGVNDLSWYDDEAGSLPRFAAAIGTIPIPIGNDGEPVNVNDLLARTLNRQWDIHHEILTDFYRIAAFASPQVPEVRQEPWRLSLLLNEDTLRLLKEQSLALEFPDQVTEVKVKKHAGTVTTNRVAVVLYGPDGSRALQPHEIDPDIPRADAA